jgi:hypothetical protein
VEDEDGLFDRKVFWSYLFVVRDFFGFLLGVLDFDLPS